MRILFHPICRTVSERRTASETVHEHSIVLNPQPKPGRTSNLVYMLQESCNEAERGKIKTASFVKLSPAYILISTHP